MLRLKEYKKSIGILIVGYCFCLTFSTQAQCYLTASDIKIETATYGEQLHRLGIDTTRIDSVYRALKEEILLKSQYAALFLAEQNKQDATGLIKQKYAAERQYPRAGLRYLKALKILDDDSAESMLTAFADSMYQVVKTGNISSRNNHVYQNVIELLIDYDNYSQFPRIIEMLKSNSYAEDTNGYLSLLIKFLDIKQFEDEIVNTLIFVLNNYSNTSSRFSVANFSCLFPDSKQLQQALRVTAIEDSSYDVRKWSFVRLQETYRDPEIIDLALKNLKTTNNRNQVRLYLSIIKDEYNPRSLLLIKKLKDESPNRLVREKAADMYKNYWWLHFKPFGKEYDYSASQILDSLIVYTRNVASYNWLGDQGFVKELNNRLENAQRHLSRGNSKNAAKQIAGFRQRVQRVYEQSKQNNNSPRFVTEDGYKFLYYNAGYLLERLPDHSSENNKN